MGNEKSALSGLDIDEKAIEITDFWLLHNASLSGTNPQNLSIFISEPSLHSTANFGKPSPLERTAKVCSKIIISGIFVPIIKQKLVRPLYQRLLFYFSEFNASSSSLYIKIHIIVA